MRVLVTGGAGFIGANLCRTLLGRDGISRVSAYDDLSTGRRLNLEAVPDAKFVAADILDFPTLLEAVQDADAVVHLAARPSVARSIDDPLASHAANASGTLNVLEAARRAGGVHVVVASSSSVYGANPVLPKSEDLVPQPRSPYAASKLSGEAYARSYAESFDLDVMVFRFFNVYGPLQAADHAYAAVIPMFISAALAGKPLPIHGDGGQTRDFTYVASVCEVLADAVQHRVTRPTPVNLAFETRTSLLELVAELEHLLGRSLLREHLPVRPGDVRDSQADNRLLLATFPDIEPVPLAEGLRQTLAWFEHLPAHR